MPRLSANTLRRYLLAGQLSQTGCLRHRPISFQPPYASRVSSIRYLSSTANEVPANSSSSSDHKPIIPLRKELKDEKKRKKLLANKNRGEKGTNKHEDWELTVGVEIHAQLNTPRKLFSPAASTIGGTPNTHVALFDLAIPGTQPNFQKETLIPAIRAALALNCTIQETSTFDRKHYFHWDQPHGYQITQYYQPFAKDGHITLYEHDGIAEEDGDEITIGIKQIQMEQDTAKTIAQPDNIHLVDFNRVGVPLIEIITLPQIHHPATAAAFVKKVQTLLNAVDACVLGMESGGLRADVNVSVKRRDSSLDTENANTNSYAGITNLGTRTEIKNLSSHKAVDAAIIAERNRQISAIEAGGVIESETRGWTLGSAETKRLRGKEGEVDYRYMPDADIPPIHIGADLIAHLKSTLGVLPDEEIKTLTMEYNLTTKDALSLVSLENGARAEYFYQVVDDLGTIEEAKGRNSTEKMMRSIWGKVAGNWVLHELGGLMSATDFDLVGHINKHLNEPMSESGLLQEYPTDWPPVTSEALAYIIFYLTNNRITGKTAKTLLTMVFNDPSIAISRGSKSIEQIVTENGWWFKPLSILEYEVLAKKVITEESEAWKQVVEGGKKGQGKIMYLVGRMMKEGNGEGRMDGKAAEGMLMDLAGVERRKSEGGVKEGSEWIVEG